MARVRKNKTGVGIITFVILMLFITFTYLMFGLKEERRDLQKVSNRLEKDINKEEERSDEIESYKVYVQTKKFIEDQARLHFDLGYEDEIRLKKADDED